METPKTKQDFYFVERLNAIDQLSKERGSLDKILLLISTGLLVLSINVLIGLKEIHLILSWLLLLSWIFLGLSILAQMFGYESSEKSLNERIKHLDEWANKEFTSFPYDEKYRNKEKETIRKIDIWNKIAFYSLIMGIILLTVFASINFNKINKENLNKQNNEIEQIEQLKE